MARSGKLADDGEATFARVRRTQDEASMAMFSMASAAVTWDRRVRGALLAMFVAIYVPLGCFMLVMPLGADEASRGGRYFLVGLLALLAISMTRARDVRRNGRATMRMILDLLVWMMVTVPLAELAKGAGLGVWSILAWLVLSIYAYVWPLCALVAVWLQMHVARRAYVVLPLLLAWQAARR